MKAILYCAQPEADWPRTFFPGVHPYMLPFLGKPLIEFYIDVCVLCKIDALLILHEDYDTAVVDFLGDGARWGVAIRHHVAGARADAATILRRNAEFVGGEPVLFLDGFFFPFYDKRIGFSADDIPVRGALRRLNVSATDAPPHPACRPVSMPTLRSYFDLNMAMLQSHADGFVLHSYGAEKGVYFGMNDVVARGAKLEPPFVVGDNSQVDENASVGPLAIVGDTCIVDKRTRVTRSIIFDKTYVGPDLEIEEKILWGSRIIDPVEGVSVFFRDPYFVSGLRDGFWRRAFRRSCECVVALSILIVGFPLFVLFKILGTPDIEWVRYPVDGDGARLGNIPRYRRKKDWRTTWFFKVSGDKYRLLWHVLRGRLRLIGDTVWDMRTQSAYIERYKHYKPAAFTFADSLGHREIDEMLLDDLYYTHNRSPKTDMQLLLRSYVGRLMRGESSR